jgi:hypothetical protein
MTRIDNQEKMLRLMATALKAKSERRVVGTSLVQKKSKAPSTKTLSRVRRLIKAGAVSEEEITPLMFSAILTDHFGAKVAADPMFPQLIQRLVDIIRKDSEADLLVGQSIEELKS